MSYTQQPPPGWYPTPDGTVRYWDGITWAPPPTPQAYPPAGSGYPAARTSSATMAVLAHLAGFFSIIATVVLYVIIDRGDGFNRRHAAEALNFQITLIIAAILCAVLGVVTLGLGLLLFLPLGVVAIVWPIKAAIAASRFQEWRYPLCIRMVRP